MPAKSELTCKRSLGGAKLTALAAIGLLVAWSGLGGQEVLRPPSGTVIVSDQNLPEVVNPEVSSSNPGAGAGPQDSLPKIAVTNSERAGVQITGYDLDVHLTPAEAGLEVRAQLTVKNVSGARLTRMPLQISSSLRWENVTGMTFTQSPVQTDADHTGYEQEVVITLAKPLGVGESIVVSALYAGKVEQSGERLELVGASATAAALVDWDAIEPTTDASATGLRGFGHVLWYPVAAPLVLLGEGKKLPDLVAREAYLNAGTALRGRVTVQYVGDPPVGVVVDGRVLELAKTPDEETTLVGETTGVATADIAPTVVGYRNLSLFLTAARVATTEDQVLSVVTPDGEAAGPWREAAEQVKPLLTEWLGDVPLEPMLELDHSGQVYEDGRFLAAPLSGKADADALVGPLTHAWFAIGGTQNLWLAQGIPEFMRLLWVERTRGRAAAVGELQHAGLLLALAEPDVAGGAAGEPLVTTDRELLLRVKSAAVLWQLRDLIGDDALRTGLAGFRHSLFLNSGLADDATAFEKALEKASGKELGWFFADWVYKDKSLPDLSIGQVTPRPLPARPGKDGGYLVVIEVKNAGDAAAEVPVTVRAGDGPSALHTTERVRVPARGSASTRIVFETVPERVEVNDGTVPELRSTSHVVDVRVAAKP